MDHLQEVEVEDLRQGWAGYLSRQVVTHTPSQEGIGVLVGDKVR